jgi:medium-chain acyl-[acyl-carrier-protein] hydrolase
LAVRNSAWASCLSRRVEAGLRLFCFPYAGGGAGIYRDWPSGLPAAIEVWAVNLPGRERRICDEPIASISGLVIAAAEGLGKYLDAPFAFFGHSMGALVSFELSRHLQKAGRTGPSSLVVSGFGAPHLPKQGMHIGDLPAPEFLDELQKLSGTPAGVLENPELIELLLPVLRADFRAVEGYEFSDGTLLSCPILAYGGTNDTDVTREHLEGWGSCTTGRFAVRLFRGDHFYLHPRRAEVIAHLGRDLLEFCS